MKRKLETKQPALAAVFLIACALAQPLFARTEKAPHADGPAAAAHEAAKGDALFEALLTELDRSKAQLKMDQVQAPYYIEYRVNDVDEFNAEAAFGALRESQRSHLRVIRVVVRIGDYKQDSFYGQGMGAASILPLDDDPIALRRQIWLLTDEAYKSAANAYAEKLSALKQFTADPNPVDDFARAPVVSSVGPYGQAESGRSRVEQHAAGCQQSLPPVSGSAIGECVGALLVRQRVFREFGRHDCAQWPHHRHGDAERRDASRGWHAAEPQSFLDRRAPGGTPGARRAAERIEADAGHAEGAARCAHRGGVLPRPGALCAGCRRRRLCRADRKQHPGAQAATRAA